MPRYLSGVQPTGQTGIPHLGNYFGAIDQHIRISQNLGPQDTAYYFIADLHALTTIQDAEELKRNIRNMAASYLALGLDVNRAVFFQQSAIPEVTELMWLLSSVTGMGLLERAVSYKDKVAKGMSANVGLFTYPVLMTADIVIYDSDIVPVGQDQVQHVEMAQDMVGYFNSRFNGEFLKRPEWRLSAAPKVPGTDGQKMSKSYGNTILVFDEGKALQADMKKIVTDSRTPDEPKDPDSITAYQLLELFLSAEEKEQWRARIKAGGKDAPGYGHIKKEIVARMDARFGPARERFHHLSETPVGLKEVDDVLHAGAEKARAVARQTLARCYDACGLVNAATRVRG